MLRAVMDPNSKRIVYRDDGIQGTSPALPMAPNAAPGEVSLPQISVGPNDPAPVAGSAPSFSMAGMAPPTMAGAMGQGMTARQPVQSDPSTPLGTHLAGLEKQYGLPQGYLAQIRAVESSNGTNLANSNSSARGPYQIINSTAKTLGLSPSDVMDEYKSSSAIAGMAAKDAAAFQNKFGTAPTGADLYGMHQQGQQGYFNLLGGQAPGGAAQSLNGGGGLSAEGFRAKIQSMYNNARPDLPGDPTTRYGSGGGATLTNNPGSINVVSPVVTQGANNGVGTAPAATATPTTTPPAYNGGLVGLLSSDNPGADAKSMLSSGSSFMGAAKGLMGALGSNSAPTLKAPGIQPSAPGDDMNTPNMSLMQMLYGMGSKRPGMQLG